MRIEKIHIEDYRGIRKCSVDLRMSRNLAVFAGSNGSGKTSLIEACRFALNQFYGIRPLPKTDFKIKVDVIADDGKCYTFYRDSVCHTVNQIGDTARPYDQMSSLPHFTGDESWFFTSWRDPHLKDGVELQTARNAEVMNIPGVTREATLVWVKERLVRWDVMARFNGDASQIKLIQGVFTRLNAARNLFFPDDPGEFVAKSVSSANAEAGIPSGSEDFKFDLFLQRNKDHKLISVNELSSGELEIMCFLGVLLLYPKLSLVYIDEPELHLNQQWHRVLLNALQTVAPSVQFIVSTHSPEIWNSVYSDQRFFIQNGVLFS